jgi:membrane dipeptidase
MFYRIYVVLVVSLARYLVADMHQDISYAIKTGGFDPKANKDLAITFDREMPGRHGDIPKYLAGGVKLVFGAIFPGREFWSPTILEKLERLYGSWHSSTVPILGSLDDVIEHISIYRSFVKRYRDRLALISRPGDLDRLVRSDKIGILISLEGADPISRLEDLEILWLLGVRSVTITWNYDNRYASSCRSKKDYGLTEEGEELVRIANNLGIILDISHTGRRTALDVLSASKLPVIASHSNYAAIHRNMRNVDDEILEGIKRVGGVVGFTMITSTIGEKPSIDSLARHIIEVWRRFGSDVLAIGTDYFGIERTPEGLEDISKIQRLFERLAEMGMGDNDLRKLGWENVERVIRAHEQRWNEDLGA